jgi:hypothetical protein
MNFDVPTKIGIGFARGAACRLASGDMTLDYSGKVLNLASRLMDMARPAGIVFDESFDRGALEAPIRKKFSDEKVYVRGVAEKTPVRVCYLDKITSIPADYKRPLDKVVWRTIQRTLTFKALKERAPNYRLSLPTPPLDETDIVVKFEYPGVGTSGRRLKEATGFLTLGQGKFSVYSEAEDWYVAIDVEATCNALESQQVKDQWHVKLKVQYPER